MKRLKHDTSPRNNLNQPLKLPPDYAHLLGASEVHITLALYQTAVELTERIEKLEARRPPMKPKSDDIHVQIVELLNYAHGICGCDGYYGPGCSRCTEGIVDGFVSQRKAAYDKAIAEDLIDVRHGMDLTDRGKTILKQLKGDFS